MAARARVRSNVRDLVFVGEATITARPASGVTTATGAPSDYAEVETTTTAVYDLVAEARWQRARERNRGKGRWED